MTIEDAARLAADRDLQLLQRAVGNSRMQSLDLGDLYVRAFRQGAQWQKEQTEAEERQLDDSFKALMTHEPEPENDDELEARVEPLITSPSPPAGSTAATD